MITRDGWAIFEEITSFTIRNDFNNVLPKKQLAGIGFTPNLDSQLFAVATSTSEMLFKSRQQLEETIPSVLPSATGLQQEGQVAQVIIVTACTMKVPGDSVIVTYQGVPVARGKPGWEREMFDGNFFSRQLEDLVLTDLEEVKIN